MDNQSIQSLFDDVVVAVASALASMEGEWKLSGLKDTQYRHDVVADDAALAVLAGAPVSVMSEETGVHNSGHDITVIIDPVDGSTNASLGLPWYAISLCALRDGVPVVSRVDNLATGDSFLAERGRGATRNGETIKASATTDLSEAIIAINGRPAEPVACQQFRTLGATALDMAFVAAGRLDGYLDADTDQIAPWDYMGALLICEEAGAVCADAFGRELVTADHTARRIPVAAATPELLEALLATRNAD